ncbi:hypothetical protein J3R83DRAFT_7938 [Lanmaoa asiatica]|nr:hypothetical protein J3R83DRAFT_7938 [Lanmaoa asiatica]
MDNISTWMSHFKKMRKMGPIIHDGVTWIKIMDIEMHMWVHTSDDPIDMDQQDTKNQAFAKGSICPDLDMSDIDKKTDLMIGLVRDMAVSCIEEARNFHTSGANQALALDLESDLELDLYTRGLDSEESQANHRLYSKQTIH